MADFITNLKNELKEECDKNKGINILLGVLGDAPDKELRTAVLTALGEIDIRCQFSAARIFIEHGGYGDDTIKYIIGNISNSPECFYNDIECYLSFFERVTKLHDYFSDNVRIEIMNTMETMFAHGFRDIAAVIGNFRRFLPSATMGGAEYDLHKQMLVTYAYNIKNYSYIHNILIDVNRECRAQKRKYMYGMINYYFTVLEVLSGKTDQVERESLGYPLRDILQSSYGVF